MRDNSRRSLLYVTETPNSLEYKTFARELMTEPTGVRSLTEVHLAHDPNIVFDVDLRSTTTMRHLKPLLQRRGLGCRIFLADIEAGVVTANARQLGADAIMSSRSRPDAIFRAIEAHFSVTAGDTVKHSIDAGVEALDDSFRSLVEDQVFDTNGMTNTSGIIADAIDQAGIQEWMNAVRGHHVGTFQHCMLVTATASAFARKSGMRRSDVVTVTAAGLLHDIGKAAIPLDILDKPGVLSSQETQIMRQHPVAGYDYLVRRSKIAPDTLRSVRSHHEYLDGSGYPDGLSGSQIDDLTRIVTIADVYAALVERRAYKAPKTPLEALTVLTAMAEAGKLERALVREFGRIMVPGSVSQRQAG